MRGLAGCVGRCNTVAAQHRNAGRWARLGGVVARESSQRVIPHHLANRGLAREPLGHREPVLRTELAQFCVVSARPTPGHTSGTRAVAAERA